MNAFLQRLRGAVAPPDGDRWDDHGVEDIAALIGDLVVAPEPTPQASASRAVVLGAFAAWSATSPQAQGRDLPTAVGAPGAHRRRPALAVLIAGVLLVTLSAGVVAASGAGGPLYDLRVSAEAMGLPAGPAERLAAQLARLDARVEDAQAAAGRGDDNGVEAALRAYASIAVDAAADPVSDATATASSAARVRIQLEAMERIGAGDPVLDAGRALAVRAANALLLALGQPPEDGGNPLPGPGYPGTTSPAVQGPSSSGHSGSGPAASGSESSATPSSGPSHAESGSPGPGATTGPQTSGAPHQGTPAGSGGAGPSAAPPVSAGPSSAPGGGARPPSATSHPASSPPDQGAGPTASSGQPSPSPTSATGGQGGPWPSAGASAGPP